MVFCEENIYFIKILLLCNIIYCAKSSAKSRNSEIYKKADEIWNSYK